MKQCAPGQRSNKNLIYCGEFKPISEFYKNRNQCKGCYSKTHFPKKIRKDTNKK